jgi:hypothetical protein
MSELLPVRAGNILKAVCLTVDISDEQYIFNVICLMPELHVSLEVSVAEQKRCLSLTPMRLFIRMVM